MIGEISSGVGCIHGQQKPGRSISFSWEEIHHLTEVGYSQYSFEHGMFIYPRMLTVTESQVEKSMIRSVLEQPRHCIPVSCL